MRSMVEIADDLRSVYIEARRLAERAEALKTEADGLRDVVVGRGEAFNDAADVYRHADAATAALERARDRMHSAFDVAAESTALRKLDLQ